MNSTVVDVTACGLLKTGQGPGGEAVRAEDVCSKRGTIRAFERQQGATRDACFLFVTALLCVVTALVNIPPGRKVAYAL